MNSIRQQLSRDLLGSTLLLLGGGVGALYFAARGAAIEQFDFTLRAKAMALSTTTVPKPSGAVVEFSDRFFPGFEGRRPRDFFEAWSDGGRPIARSESLGPETDLPLTLGTLDHPKIWNLTLPTHRAGRAIGFTFLPKSRNDIVPRARLPTVGLVVASDREELDETLWTLVAIAGVTAALLATTTLWLVPRLLRGGLRPLDQLAFETARIDATSLSTRFAVDGLPDELRPIATRLNDLLARLELSFQRERRFSADLAHELRTPLAELRSIAECALKWPDSRDATTDRETLAVAEQMERLVGVILALARAENGGSKPDMQRTALDEFVRDAWQPFAAPATVRRIKISMALSAVSAQADGALLRSILTNLFDNAVDYTPADGALEIRLRDEGGRAVIQVSNDAPDLSASDLPNLFDRFWRKEASRTSGKHLGLGLSLARGFAEAMGWSLTASYEGARLTFALVSIRPSEAPPAANV